MFAFRKPALGAAVVLSLGLTACGGHGASAIPPSSALPQANAARIPSAMHAMNRGGARIDVDEVASLRLAIDASGDGTFTLARGRRVFFSPATRSVPIPAFTLTCAHRGDRDDRDDRCRFGRRDRDGDAYYYVRERIVRRGDWDDRGDRDTVETYVTGPGTLAHDAIAFPAANAPLALGARVRYRFDLVRSNEPLATPTPIPTPTPTATPATIGFCRTYASSAAAAPLPATTPAPTNGNALSGFITIFTDANVSVPGAAALACGPNGTIDEVGAGNGNGSLDAFAIAGDSFAPIDANSFSQNALRLLQAQIGVDASGTIYLNGIYSPTLGAKGSRGLISVAANGTTTAIPGYLGLLSVGTGSDGAAYAVAPDTTGSASYDLVRVADGAAGTRIPFPAACTGIDDYGAFAADGNGNLWFADAACGFVRYAASTQTFSAFASGATANGGVLAVGPDGAIYLGGTDQLVRLDPASGAAATISLAGTTIDAMIAGPSDELYLAAHADDGSAAWIERYSPQSGAIVRYPGPTGVTAMVIGGDGAIYAGTDSATLIRIDPSLAGK